MLTHNTKSSKLVLQFSNAVTTAELHLPVVSIWTVSEISQKNLKSKYTCGDDQTDLWENISIWNLGKQTS